MTVDVEVHATIDRPRAEVAGYCCDPENVTAWYGNVTAVQWETVGPMAIGSRFRFTSDFLGRRLQYTYEVLELVPFERLIMRSDKSPFRMETAYTFQDTAGAATWMTVRNRGEPTAYSGLAPAILATAIRRATSNDLARLKRILEAC
ncbi:MAG: hypothetical protein QOJ24_2692 [Mycobacterium sp.]|jgi:uncharacterized protein YndB with AHSA1/START domain|nr:hypothetical protein [Mycobacterium sp.]